MNSRRLTRLFGVAAGAAAALAVGASLASAAQSYTCSGTFDSPGVLAFLACLSQPD